MTEERAKKIAATLVRRAAAAVRQHAEQDHFEESQTFAGEARAA